MSFKKLQFARLENEGLVQATADLAFLSSVTFFITESDKTIATLTTNNKKTFAQTVDGYKLFLKSKWFFNNSWKYVLYGDSGQTIATIHVRKGVLTFFKPSTYDIIFHETNEVLVLRKWSRKERKSINADFRYEFTIEGKVACWITNYQQPPRLYSPPTTKLNGDILFDSHINLLKVLSCLQAVNIHIDLEFDI